MCAGPHESLQIPASDLNPFGQPSLIGRVREWLRSHRAQHDDDPDDLDSAYSLVLELDSFTLLSTFFDRLFSELRTSKYNNQDFSKEAWFNRILHHVVIMTAVFHRFVEEIEKGTRGNSHSARETLSLLIASVTPIRALATSLHRHEPSLAKAIVDALQGLTCFSHHKIVFHSGVYQLSSKDGQGLVDD